MTFGDIRISKINLGKNSDRAEFMDIDCNYTFDGTTLTIDCSGLTVVFKKAT